MRIRLNVGPVFVYEWIALSRRWQIYAARSCFGMFLLASLSTVWWANDFGQRAPTIRMQAEVGQEFYQALVWSQLILLLIAAPAATAGTICLDKARGTMTHLLVTDLSNTEIILGKLAAGPVPLLGLVATALPIMALTTFLGGIDPRALTGIFLLSLGVAFLSCVLALVLSVWGTKPHEVLLTSYTILMIWVLGGPVWEMLSMLGAVGSGPPAWVSRMNPFWLAFANSWQLGTVDLGQAVLFLGGSVVISAGLTTLAIFWVRSVAAQQAGQAPGRSRWLSRRVPGRSLSERIGPQLDFNPVLWREWHRRRPSRGSRILWWFYAGVSTFFSGVAIRLILQAKSPGSQECMVLNGLQVAFGFLLLSVASATSLAEERARGSLDILLATPMTNRSIVLGKWWGAFRGTIWLSILPTLVTAAVAWQYGRWSGAFLLWGLLLSFGAALTSLGLALATWVSRLGRAIALTVTAYVLVTVGWCLFSLILTQSANSYDLGLLISCGSPMFASFYLPIVMQASGTDWPLTTIWFLFLILAQLSFAGILLLATLASFDRCLGRVATSTGFTRTPQPQRREPQPQIDKPAIMG